MVISLLRKIRDGAYSGSRYTASRKLLNHFSKIAEMVLVTPPDSMVNEE
jgi:hypothetical protein